MKDDFICAHCLYSLNEWYEHTDFDNVMNNMLYDPYRVWASIYSDKPMTRIKCFLIQENVLPHNRKILFMINGINYIGEWRGFFKK